MISRIHYFRIIFFHKEFNNKRTYSYQNCTTEKGYNYIENKYFLNAFNNSFILSCTVILRNKGHIAYAQTWHRNIGKLLYPAGGGKTGYYISSKSIYSGLKYHWTYWGNTELKRNRNSYFNLRPWSFQVKFKRRFINSIFFGMLKHTYCRQNHCNKFAYCGCPSSTYNTPFEVTDK